ncbi:hypothetical protein WJX72_001264 [[Myrmecia] bisecta]|uniref:non-specific serine/threonine protein kinase n=1 Tax=[Myrmecia] bisecta TaxID=41462 RepID=A0AAW1Q3D0_9CHLO
MCTTVAGRSKHIYICYDSKDEETARTLHANLLAAGFAPFLDVLDIHEWPFYKAPLRALHALEERLSKPQVRMVALTGMFGMGKSSLARHLAASIHVPGQLDRFEGVLWVHCGQDCSSEALLQKQRELLRDLKDLSSVGSNAEVHLMSVDHGKKELEKLLNGRSYLLILDDVWEKPTLDAFRFHGHLGTLLVTSRLPTIELCADASTVKLTVEDNRTVAMAILASLALDDPQRQTVDDDFVDVAQRIIMREYEDPAPHSGAEAATRARWTIYGAISLSFSAGLSADEQRVLRAMGLFACGERVPVEVLKLACRAQDCASSPRCPVRPLVLQRLVGRNLLEQDDDGMLQVHDLVADYLRRQLNPVTADLCWHKLGQTEQTLLVLCLREWGHADFHEALRHFGGSKPAAPLLIRDLHQLIGTELDAWVASVCTDGPSEASYTAAHVMTMRQLLVAGDEPALDQLLLAWSPVSSTDLPSLSKKVTAWLPLASATRLLGIQNMSRYGIWALAPLASRKWRCASPQGSVLPSNFWKRGDKVTKYVERELLNHRLLCHPHVIQFKQVFLTRQYMCIVMEFAAGGNLFEHVLRKGGLKEADARWFFQQLIIAVDYMHRMGVANRDLSLENTLLGSEPRPLLKIGDFSYSKHEKFQSAPGSRAGTPAYLAPEVIQTTRGQTYDGKIADIWSCGVMLYVMLVGEFPFVRPEDKFDNQPRQRMTRRILKAQYEFPPHVKVSHECRNLLCLILQLEPARRITLQQIQQHPWYLKDLPPGSLTMNAGLRAATDQQVVREAQIPPRGPTHWDNDEYIDDAMDPADEWDNALYLGLPGY